MSVCRAAVILERAEQGIDTGQVARLIQATGCVAVEIKASGDEPARGEALAILHKPVVVADDGVTYHDRA